MKNKKNILLIVLSVGLLMALILFGYYSYFCNENIQAIKSSLNSDNKSFLRNNRMYASISFLSIFIYLALSVYIIYLFVIVYKNKINICLSKNNAEDNVSPVKNSKSFFRLIILIFFILTALVIIGFNIWFLQAQIKAISMWKLLQEYKILSNIRIYIAFNILSLIYLFTAIASSIGFAVFKNKNIIQIKDGLIS